ncbi:MAG: hypothetical protein NVS3B5_13000 [Sphingomicrobium sp.]
MMNYNEQEFREKVMDIALQLVLVTGLMNGANIKKRDFQNRFEREVNKGHSNSVSLRKWAEYSFAMRRHREKIFGPTLFSDPAWDIMLNVLMSDLDGEPLTVSNASVVANMPMTTGIRGIDRLEVAGLVQRIADPSDRRVIWVRTTAKALQLLTRQFEEELDVSQRLNFLVSPSQDG